MKEQVMKAMKGVFLLKFLSTYVNQNVLDLSYKMYVIRHLDYGDVIFHNQGMDLWALLNAFNTGQLLCLGAGRELVGKTFLMSLVGSRCLTGGLVV